MDIVSHFKSRLFQSLIDMNSSYRKSSLIVHPDKPTGDLDAFMLLNQAREIGIVWFANGFSSFCYDGPETQYSLKRMHQAKGYDFKKYCPTHCGTDKPTNVLVKGVPTNSSPFYTNPGHTMRWTKAMISAVVISKGTINEGEIMHIQNGANAIQRHAACFNHWVQVGLTTYVGESEFDMAYDKILQVYAYGPRKCPDKTFNPFLFCLVRYFALKECPLYTCFKVKAELAAEAVNAAFDGDPPGDKYSAGHPTAVPTYKTKEEFDDVLTHVKEQASRDVKQERDEAKRMLSQQENILLLAKAQAVADLKKEMDIAKRSLCQQLKHLEKTETAHAKIVSDVLSDQKRVILEVQKTHDIATNKRRDHIHSLLQSMSVELGPDEFDPTTQYFAEEKKFIDVVYKFFSSIDVDPTHGHFRLRDAFRQAWVFEENWNDEETGVPHILKAKKEDTNTLDDMNAAAESSMRSFMRGYKNDPGNLKFYRPNKWEEITVNFMSLVQILLSSKKRVRFRNMVARLTTRDRAPSPYKKAVLQLHLAHIADGNVDHNVACTVLGLSTLGQKVKYLADMKACASVHPSCQALSSKSGRLCGKKAQYGKQFCSPHKPFSKKRRLG
jgi:hypothetical protein